MYLQALIDECTESQIMKYKLINTSINGVKFAVIQILLVLIPLNAYNQTDTVHHKLPQSDSTASANINKRFIPKRYRTTFTDSLGCKFVYRRTAFNVATGKQYDSEGRVVSKIRNRPGDTAYPRNTKQRLYTYHTNGKLKTKTTIKNKGSWVDTTTTKKYDENGKLISKSSGTSII